MGAKALYTDTSEKIIAQLILANDIDALIHLQKDRDEYVKYSAGWDAVNFDEYISQFRITDETFNMEHNNRKISFWDNGKEYEIVCSVSARYFRVRRKEYYDSTGRKHGAVYVGLNLKEPNISKDLTGPDARSERNRLTHFKMTYKKGV